MRLQVYEREASSRQVEVGQLRKIVYMHTIYYHYTETNTLAGV